MLNIFRYRDPLFLRDEELADHEDNPAMEEELNVQSFNVDCISKSAENMSSPAVIQTTQSFVKVEPGFCVQTVQNSSMMESREFNPSPIPAAPSISNNTWDISNNPPGSKQKKRKQSLVTVSIKIMRAANIADAV